MTDLRPVCVDCSRIQGEVIRYTCEKNGAVVPYSNGIQRGDLYECAYCGSQIVVGLGSATYPFSTSSKKFMLERLNSEWNILHGVET